MLFGPSSVVDGYCKLERIERGVALTTLRSFPADVSLWYRGLTIMEEPFLSTVFLAKGDPTAQATIARLKLLTLSLSTSKAALDLLLEGQYSLAFSAIRHLLESTVQVIYLATFPEHVGNWNIDSETPGMRKMIDQLRKETKPRASLKEYADKFDQIYDHWRFLSKGSHPTGLGLSQIEDQNDSTQHFLGTHFREDLAVIGFVSGHFVLDTLLLGERLTVKPTPGWDERCEMWVAESRRRTKVLQNRAGFEHLWQEVIKESEDSV